MNGTPLHAMNPTGRFTDRAADYARFRPTYPAAAVDAILNGLGPAEKLTAVDVGAGTGISARLVADRGAHVVAVEPNDSMRAAAEAHPRIAWRAGTGEATGLEPGSADLILCAQAFHWFRQDEAIKEFARVLRQGGRLAIVWNDRDRTDALMTEYRDAIAAAGGEHPAEARAFDPKVVAHGGSFDDPTLFECPNNQVLDEAGLIGRVMSASYAPKHGPAAEALKLRLSEIYSRFKDARGGVTLRYITRVWIASRR